MDRRNQRRFDKHKSRLSLKHLTTEFDIFSFSETIDFVLQLWKFLCAKTLCHQQQIPEVS